MIYAGFETDSRQRAEPRRRAISTASSPPCRAGTDRPISTMRAPRQRRVRTQRRDAHGRKLGRRRARRQGHRLQARGRRPRTDEAIVFGWVEWPDKATRDAGMKALMEDPEMQRHANAVRRHSAMIFGGFTPDPRHRPHKEPTSMPNPEGTPIWYELLTADAAASTKFYEHVIGWTVQPASRPAAMDYRMIDTRTAVIRRRADAADAGNERRRRQAELAVLYRRRRCRCLVREGDGGRAARC